MFEVIYKAELAALTNSTTLVETFWNEIKNQYEKKNRYYHNLTHLNHLITELLSVKDKINDWQILVFAVAYHDIVYNPLRNDNEEKSALLANDRLSRLALNSLQIEACMLQIMATAKHELSADADTNYFTDADLAIFGAEAEVYRLYTENIRKEYRHYPDIIYKPGRRKVLRHFLQMQTIYKTAYFQYKYEQQARVNIANELKILA